MRKLPETHGSWLSVLAVEKRVALEGILGVQLGDVLGCGHFGCVLDSDSPWAVKLTTDPVEVEMWVQLQNAIAKKGSGQWGLTRVKEIVRLKPNLHGKRVWAVMREKVEPLLAAETGTISERTRVEIGLPPPQYEDYEEWKSSLIYRKDHDEYLGDRLEHTYGMNPTDVAATLTMVGNLRRFNHALLEYDSVLYDTRDARASYKWATEKGDDRKNVAGWVKCRIQTIFGWTISTPSAHPFESIYHTLFDLAYYEVYLGDLALENIGWRVAEKIESSKMPAGLVIFDPRLHTGESSGKKLELPERLVQNRGRR